MASTGYDFHHVNFDRGMLMISIIHLSSIYSTCPHHLNYYEREVLQPHAVVGGVGLGVIGKGNVSQRTNTV
jgi:hypothetical protein